MSSPAPFTLCTLQRKDRNYFYVLFRDPRTGKRMNKKSVERLRTELGIIDDAPITRRDEAVRISQMALDRGIVFGAPTQEVYLIEYLRTFYDWEQSPYVQRRNTIAPNSIGEDYITTRRSLIENHLLQHIPTKLLLSEVTLSWLEDLQYALVKHSTLASSTINVIMSALLTALNDAQRRGAIPQSTSLELQHLNVTHQARGVLTEAELAAFLSYAKNHTEERIYLACTLALITGMRSGELRALRKAAVQEDLIIIDQAYADRAGLKEPKGKQVRYVPCPSWLTERLLTLADTSPFPNEHQLIFWSKRTGSFVSSHYFNDRFTDELIRSKAVKAETIKARNISFHSLRHMANTLLRGTIDEHLLRMTLGHTSAQLSDLYTHLNQRGLQQVAEAQRRMILSLVEDGNVSKADKLITEREV